MAGPILGMLGSARSARCSATQVGSGPRRARRRGAHRLRHRPAAGTEPARPRWCPTNVAAFAEGLDVPEDDVLLYLALREAAHQRLFAHVPWLRDHLIGAVTDYARGIEINIERIQQRDRGADARHRPDQPRVACSSCSRAACSSSTRLPRAEGRAAAARGRRSRWSRAGSTRSSARPPTERMPTAAKLQEAVRRRRAAGGPAEQTFAALVGLELRPRRLRDASTLWGSLRTRQGAEARDGVWMHPDLLPTAADLDDPLGFREGAARRRASSARRTSTPSCASCSTARLGRPTPTEE